MLLSVAAARDVEAEVESKVSRHEADSQRPRRSKVAQTSRVKGGVRLLQVAWACEVREAGCPPIPRASCGSRVGLPTDLPPIQAYKRNQMTFKLSHDMHTVPQNGWRCTGFARIHMRGTGLEAGASEFQHVKKTPSTTFISR